jgi:cytochrome c oxidase cbb3-type subunit 3
MSDFFSPGWSIFIAIVTIVGIIWCLWLLMSQRKTKVPTDSSGNVTDTGHVWDDDLRELNNPLPRWWMWMFIISCIFGAIYLVLYPGLGAYQGILGYSTQAEHDQSVQTANKDLQPVYAKYMQMSIEQVAADPKANEMGQRLFLNYCAQCHGSDAGGSKGFPNLHDKDYLYGGEPELIRTSIVQGRAGVMPAFGHLSSVQISEVVAYVRSLSNLPANDLRVAQGEVVYKSNCAACHGPDGRGNIILGAPNLTDRVWLYGSSEKAITETVQKGRNGVMPGHEAILTPEKIQILTAYVWGLSHQPMSTKK